MRLRTRSRHTLDSKVRYVLLFTIPDIVDSMSTAQSYNSQSMFSIIGNRSRLRLNVDCPVVQFAEHVFHNRQSVSSPNCVLRTKYGCARHGPSRSYSLSPFFSNYGTGGNVIKDPRVVLRNIIPQIHPSRITTSINQSFHHTNSMSRKFLRSRSASGVAIAPRWTGTPPRLIRPRRSLSATGYDRFNDRTHPNTPKSPSVFKLCRRHRRLHRRAACAIEPLDLYASDGTASQ